MRLGAVPGSVRLALSPLLLSLSMMSGPPTDGSSQTRNQKTFLRSASAVLWDVDGTLVDRQASLSLVPSLLRLLAARRARGRAARATFLSYQ